MASNNRKSIINEIDSLRLLNDFIQANEELAANNMRRIRDAVVKRRDFLKELIEIYNDVRLSYKKKIDELIKRGSLRPGSFGMIKKNNKNLYMFLSTNTGLYGDIVRRTYKAFKDKFSSGQSEAMIIGKIGKHMFEEDFPGVNFKYFDFPDNKIETSLLKPIILEIINYEKVVVFHAKYMTLIEQQPNEFVISETKINEGNRDDRIRYLFEPSLDKIVNYFEKEIFGSIFEQTMQESGLAKYAARMVALDQATENIKRSLIDLNFRNRLIKHRTENKQQINSLAILASRGRI